MDPETCNCFHVHEGSLKCFRCTMDICKPKVNMRGQPEGCSFKCDKCGEAFCVYHLKEPWTCYKCYSIKPCAKCGCKTPDRIKCHGCEDKVCNYEQPGEQFISYDCSFKCHDCREDFCRDCLQNKTGGDWLCSDCDYAWKDKSSWSD